MDFQLVDWTIISKNMDHSKKWLQVEGNEHHGQTKRTRHSKFFQVDKALMMWFSRICTQRGIINDAMICEKEIEFRDAFGISVDNLKFSLGWLRKFKWRYGIASHNLHGESSDANAHNVSMSQPKLPIVIATYASEDGF